MGLSGWWKGATNIKQAGGVQGMSKSLHWLCNNRMSSRQRFQLTQTRLLEAPRFLMDECERSAGVEGQMVDGVHAT